MAIVAPEWLRLPGATCHPRPHSEPRRLSRSRKPSWRVRSLANALGSGLAVCLAAFAATPTLANPQASALFPFGVSWYPEQFPESEWDHELSLMVRARITYVRVAEFSWANLEPAEGQYDFGWLDRAIAAASAHGIRVLIGTPTASPPAWLTTKYPDVLAVGASGVPARHGWRRQFSVASPRYRVFAADIAGRLAQRYGGNPDVIGFQIDNEYGRYTYDPVMRSRFQNWMASKYHSIGAFNDEQFNVYWSLKYDDWSQINIPGEQDQPGLWLDWLRFCSDMWREYQRNQLDAMRPYLGADKLVTTNYVAKYDEFDFSVPAQDLDLVGWDWYFDEPTLDPADGAMQHDLYRGFLGRAPWVLETAAGEQSGPVPTYRQPAGETRAMAWQAIGHGADGYAFWVWRTPLNGPETPHGSMIDAAGRPRPIFDEIAKTGAEIQIAWPRLRGSIPVVNAAILYDYPNRWSIERQPQTKDYDVWDEFVRFRRALMPVTSGVDVIRDGQALKRYPLVIAPNIPLLSKSMADALEAYVRDGGNLLIGPRAGQKNENNRMWQPSPLEDLIGSRVDVSEPPSRPIKLNGIAGEGVASRWAERVTIEKPDTEVLSRYGSADGWLDGHPAIVTRKVGKGHVTYLGTWPDQTSLNRLISRLAAQAGIGPAWPDIPAGVEVETRRSDKGSTIFVVQNWSGQSRTIRLPRTLQDILSNRPENRITLPTFGIAVLGEVR
ncbi:beta-galactosidase [Nostoc sp. 3335mG]|nr:beta-galactosidase [Nostoc sp. 3335mG]